MEDLEVWEIGRGNFRRSPSAEGRGAGEDRAEREIAEIKRQIADIDANIERLRSGSA